VEKAANFTAWLVVNGLAIAVAWYFFPSQNDQAARETPEKEFRRLHTVLDRTCGFDKVNLTKLNEKKGAAPETDFENGTMDE